MSLKANLMQAARELANEEAAAQPAGKSALFPGSDAPKAHRPAPPEGEPVTAIGAETVIEGSIRTNGSLVLYGAVYGDITGQGDLNLCGKIEGNVNGKNIRLNGVSMKGNVTAQGRLSVDAHSAVIGDVRAEELSLNGKIRGDVTVSGTLAMESCAAIVGSVNANRLSVEEGALVNGDLRIGEAD